MIRIPALTIVMLYMFLWLKSISLGKHTLSTNNKGEIKKLVSRLDCSTDTTNNVVIWLSLLFLLWSTYRPRSDTKHRYDENNIRLHRSETGDFNNTSVLTGAWTLCLMLEWLYNHVFYKLITFSSFFQVLFCNW